MGDYKLLENGQIRYDITENQELCLRNDSIPYDIKINSAGEYELYTIQNGSYKKILVVSTNHNIDDYDMLFLAMFKLNRLCDQFDNIPVKNVQYDHIGNELPPEITKISNRGYVVRVYWGKTCLHIERTKNTMTMDDKLEEATRILKFYKDDMNFMNNVQYLEILRDKKLDHLGNKLPKGITRIMNNGYRVSK